MSSLIILLSLFLEYAYIPLINTSAKFCNLPLYYILDKPYNKNKPYNDPMKIYSGEQPNESVESNNYESSESDSSDTDGFDKLNELDKQCMNTNKIPDVLSFKSYKLNDSADKNHIKLSHHTESILMNEELD